MMDDDEKHLSRRFTDVPGTIEWRILALEKTSDDREVRLRKQEQLMMNLTPKVDNIVESLKEVKENGRVAASRAEDAKDAAEAAATTNRGNYVRTLLTFLGGAFLIILAQWLVHMYTVPAAR